MENNSNVWKSEKLAKSFLEGVRGGIPLAEEQIAIFRRIILKWKPKIRNFIDLGCGDGILGASIFTINPKAKGSFIDISNKMLETAKMKCKSNVYARFINADFGNPDWPKSIRNRKPFDLIVSGFSIHHQPDKRKKELYSEIYNLLAPEGIFLNLEHVASPSKGIEPLFDDYFIDSLYAYNAKSNSGITREKIMKEYYNRPDKTANILCSTETQCDWLRKIGFKDVDCFFKVFELALFGGRK